MQGIVNRLGNLNWGQAAYAVFVLCATAAILPGQTLTTLHSFNYSDGEYPYAGLVQATNGNFYGTTYGGGVNGYGTVFKVTPSGTLTTLFNFCLCPDGADPRAGLVQATNGDLYGTTSAVGAHGGGTVFRITPGGTLTTLYSFCSQNNCADGDSPYGALVQATKGAFYGTTPDDGANGGGTVFKITPSGLLTTLYSFCAPKAGARTAHTRTGGWSRPPMGISMGQRRVTGSTAMGLSSNLSAGLGPFVKTQPTSGPVGAVVKILGTDLTRRREQRKSPGGNTQSSVTFNGVAAFFEVVSRTEITTTVPRKDTLLERVRLLSHSRQSLFIQYMGPPRGCCPNH